MKDLKEYIQQLKQNGDDIITQLAQLVVPELEGQQDLKKALLLYLVNDRDLGKLRDRIHLLLVGEPGTGKSLVMQWLESVFGAKYLTGEDLRASSLKGDARRKDYGVKILQQVDEYHDGLLCIDEFDLFPDKDALRSAMESGRIIIAKGGREKELRTRVRVIAGANELRMSSPVLSRFDFVFHFDKPTPSESKRIASKIAKIRAGIFDYDVQTLRDYVDLAQSHRPQLLREEVSKIEKVFDAYFDIKAVGKEGRWIDSVFRIATAIAKIYFEDITAEHIVKALEMKDPTLKRGEIEELLEIASQ